MPKQNPFLSEVGLKISTKLVPIFGDKMEAVIKDTKSKETIKKGEVVFALRETKDKASYIKIYNNGLDFLLDFSNAEIKVFLYIFKKIKQDQDFIFLSIKDYLDYYSNKKAYYSTLQKLELHSILKKDDYFEEKYWLNPLKIFNGDRNKLMWKFNNKKDVL